MALVVDTNSYLDVTDADTYFSDRLFSEEWEEYDIDDKPKALILATAYLDNGFLWSNDKTDDAQSLEFPRNEETTVPQIIKDAQCEIALLLIKNDFDLESSPDIMKIDKIWIENYSKSIFTDLIVNMVSPYGVAKIPKSSVQNVSVYR